MAMATLVKEPSSPEEILAEERQVIAREHHGWGGELNERSLSKMRAASRGDVSERRPKTTARLKALNVKDADTVSFQAQREARTGSRSGFLWFRRSPH
jgi:hypothetical protein